MNADTDQQPAPDEHDPARVHSPARVHGPAMHLTAVHRRNQWALSFAQLLSGIGIAVGFAVGGLLAEDLTGRAEYAGFAQTASILGAGLIAIPLARLAEKRSRRYSLSLGFTIALIGAMIILAGARWVSPVIFFVGMVAFGSATATGLQARYAATDTAPERLKGRSLSIVVWATTIGSVAGPNLAGPGGDAGELLGVGRLAGPFALSVLAYLGAVLCTSRLRSARASRHQRKIVIDKRAESRYDDPLPDAPGSDASRRPTLVESFRAIMRTPHALLGFAAVVLGHTIMVSVMVMTPIHMKHSGDTIELIGVVISLHILGMYALSPVFGLLADRVGAVPVIWLGFTLFTAAALVGIADDQLGSAMPRISTALALLGLGWSACFIAGSTLLTASLPVRFRVTAQGATDAAMNFGAAIFAAVAGPLLTLGGFTLINVVALVIVGLGITVALHSKRLHSVTARVHLTP